MQTIPVLLVITCILYKDLRRKPKELTTKVSNEEYDLAEFDKHVDKIEENILKSFLNNNGKISKIRNYETYLEVIKPIGLNEDNKIILVTEPVLLEEKSDFANFLIETDKSTDNTDSGATKLNIIEKAFINDFNAHRSLSQPGLLEGQNDSVVIDPKYMFDRAAMCTEIISSDKKPFLAIDDEEDLSVIRASIQLSPKYPLLRNLGISAFIPTDSALQSTPINFSALTDLKNRILATMNENSVDYQLYNMPRADLLAPNINNNKATLKEKILKDFEAVVLFGVVKKQIHLRDFTKPNSMLLKTEYKGKSICLRTTNAVVNENCELVSEKKSVTLYNKDMNCNPGLNLLIDDIPIKQIVSAKGGLIFKLDQPLNPVFNDDAPTLLEFLRTNPSFRIIYSLVKASGLAQGWLEKAGPTTFFLIKDDNWRLGHLKVPDCFFKAIMRPENQNLLQKLMKWLSLPGYFTFDDIQKNQWLYNLEGTFLKVTTISQERWAETQKIINSYADSEDSDKLIHTLKDVVFADGVENDPELMKNSITFIEGKQIIEKNILLANGIAHIISELPMRPDIDLRKALWDCVDYICKECPITTRFILSYFDDGGLLPDLNQPRNFVVPPGVRPDWVCAGLNGWFPPCWDKHDWDHYRNVLEVLNSKKRSNVNHASRLAAHYTMKSGYKRDILLDKLRQADHERAVLQGVFGNTQNFISGKHDDFNKLLGRLLYHRNVVDLPKICKPSVMRHRNRHGFLQDSSGPYFTSDDNDDTTSKYLPLKWNELSWFSQLF